MPASHLRLLTFLGTGRLNEVSYTWEGRTLRTGFVAEALAFFMQPDEIVILATKKAQEAHLAEVRRALADRGGFPEPEVREIPDGNQQQVLWQQFDILKEALRPPDRQPVVLDITHGWRTLPFFAGAAVAFVRAVDENPADVRIVYGAFDARNQETGETPIWDLTRFVQVVDWAHALALFLKTGRAGEVAKATAKVGEPLKKESHLGGQHGPPSDAISKLGMAFQRFGEDLATVRTGSLLLGAHQGKKTSRAQILRDQVRAARGEVARHLPPLGDILDRVEELADGLVAEDLASEQGRQALGRLARFYWKLERYPEVFITVREALVSRFACHHAANPGPGCSVMLRNQAEQKFYDNARDLRRSLAAVRNDVEHGGYREHPAPAGTLIKQASTLVETLEDVRGLGLEEIGEPLAPVFVNITNHPQEAWEEPQVQAALDLCTNIVDIPFPPVDPRADPEDLKPLAEEILEKLPSGTTHALVQGEFTLTLLLVRKLQDRGIVCLAGTSTRKVLEESGGLKTSAFRFVRFREYPQP